LVDEVEAKPPKGQEKSEMARPALVPVGEPDLMMFAIVLPLARVHLINRSALSPPCVWDISRAKRCLSGQAAAAQEHRTQYGKTDKRDG
jgi:hypothetical protein